MDRKQEYWALISALDETPAALEDTVARAQARCRKTRARRWLGIPAATLGGLASAFVLLVNCSLPFAMACKDVPLLREMAAAVAFSPTLKAAVENDYYQYVGQSQTADGVTLTVHHLIFDPGQMSVFFTIDQGPAQSYRVGQDLSSKGSNLSASYGSAVASVGGEMESLTLTFTTADALPQVFPLHLQAEVQGPAAPTRAPEVSSPWGRSPQTWSTAAIFVFDLPLDPRFTAPPEVLEVNRWVDLNGQRILIKSLEVYPLTAKLSLGEDGGNTVWLNSLEYYLEDGAGNRYDRRGGISALGAFDSQSTLTYFCGSPFFSGSPGLTLHITGAQWLRKEDHFFTLDLETGAAQGLPPWARVVSIQRTGKHVQLAIGYTGAETSPVITGTYYDPEGGAHDLTGMSSTSNSEKNDAVDYITLEDYPWSAVRLELRFTDFGPLGTPIALPLT